MVLDRIKIWDQKKHWIRWFQNPNPSHLEHGFNVTLYNKKSIINGWNLHTICILCRNFWCLCVQSAMQLPALYPVLICSNLCNFVSKALDFSLLLHILFTCPKLWERARTPLLAATQKGSLKVVKFLVDSNGNVIVIVSHRYRTKITNINITYTLERNEHGKASQTYSNCGCSDTAA